MKPSRQTVAQHPPDPVRDYRRFPSRTIRFGSRWYRQHRHDLNPWWFSNSLEGRFDLSTPNGTCYLASTPQAATRERVGPDLAAAGHVAASVMHGRVISALLIPETVRAANLDSDRAGHRYGITSELATMVGYAVPQAWAHVLHAAGFGGLVARLRFSPSGQQGVALFGEGGSRTEWQTDPDPRPLVEEARHMGIQVVRPPDNDQITIIRVPIAFPEVSANSTATAPTCVRSGGNRSTDSENTRL